MVERNEVGQHRPDMKRVGDGLLDFCSGGIRVALEFNLLQQEKPYSPLGITEVLKRKLKGEDIVGLEGHLLDFQRVMSAINKALDL
ncbi:hypothetical protein HYT74_00245 [Candidatus Daviesbacteria bacterium]|nr:hypothetical protein [Candidatus Daviesbacteria bacterium]